MAALGYPSVVAQALRPSVRPLHRDSVRWAMPFSHDFYTSEWGTLGAAIVSPIDEDESLIVVSMAPYVQRFHTRVGLAESPRAHRLAA